jgi:protein-disulfide isomerase
MVPPAPGTQPGKKDRREEAREKARIEREAQKRKERRNRILLQGGIGLAVIAIIVVVVLLVVNANKPVVAGPGPKNMASDGILIAGSNLDAVRTPALTKKETPTPTDRSKHTDTVNIVTYIDYQCPYCDQFETTNESQISDWVKAGEATIEIHPISFLDHSSLGNKYSTRAANAAACVANYDPDNFFAVNTALFANQPAENTGGKTDKEIIATLKSAGSSSDAISSCITSQKFVPWVAAASKRIDTTGQTVVFKGVANTPTVFGGTPTVFVNGEQYKGSLTSASDFASFVQAQTK